MADISWEVFIPALAAAGSFGAWLHSRWAARRAAEPIIRASWSMYPEYFEAKCEIQNRTKDDLIIHRVAAKRGFFPRVYAGTYPAEPITEVLKEIGSTVYLRETIKPEGVFKRTFFVDARSSNQPRLRFQISSSHGLVRKRWFKAAFRTETALEREVRAPTRILSNTEQVRD